MPKNSKEKYETIREKVAKDYKTKIAEKDDLIKRLCIKNEELSKENSNLERKISEQNQVIEKLLKHLNLSPEEMKILLEADSCIYSAKKLMERYFGHTSMI